MANPIYPGKLIPGKGSEKATSQALPESADGSGIDNSALEAYSAVEHGLNQVNGQVDQALLEGVHLLNPDQTKSILNTARTRFHTHIDRHPGIDWVEVLAKFEANPEKLWSYFQMEMTGGQPDVVGFENGNYIIFDCSEECPVDRKEIVYDSAAEKHLRGAHPAEICNGNAVDMAQKMGISILNTVDIARLHLLGEFDRHTRVWVETGEDMLNPPDKNKDSSALYCYSDEEGYYILEGPPYIIYSGLGFRGKLIL